MGYRRTGMLLALGVALGWQVGAGAAPGSAGLVRYSEAHRALATGQYTAALAHFESLPPSFVLADYAAFFAAESLLRAGDETQALERFRAFTDRFPDATLVPQALLAAADTAFRLGRWSDAEREARRFLARAPAHAEAGRVLVRLAEARAAQGLVAEAVADLRRRWIDAPASPWGEAAREVMEDLARRHALAVAPLSGEEQLLRAQRLVEANELSAAVRMLEDLTEHGSEPEIRHRALSRLAPSLARLGRGPEAIALLQAAVTEPPSPWRGALLYELARLHRRAGQPALALPVLERLTSEHGDYVQIADAWLALARTRLDLGQVEAARAAFQTVLRVYPDSAAAVPAGWEAAWLEYRARQFRDAALAFRQLSAVAPTHRLAGLYWAGRALDAASEKAAAAALFREVVSRGPHTYYGILAARRVRGPVPTPVAAPMRLAPNPAAALEREPHYQKGQALWRLGFEGHALVELETVGREAGPDTDRVFGLGVAFAELGETGRSLRHLRRAFGLAAEAGTPGLTTQFWRLLYPMGYGDLVRAAARRVSLDPFFVAAVIREESSYDARARSGVGAVGLMQLMPDTARLLADVAGVGLGDPAALWEPPVNIALGATYLAQLRARFGDLLLATASYNAGPHRVQRWLAERRTGDMEEFVDLIPFDETRAFVKRVYSSWQQYRRLYGGPERPPHRGEAEAAPRSGR